MSFYTFHSCHKFSVKGVISRRPEYMNNAILPNTVMSIHLQRFLENYANFDSNTIDSLPDIYHKDIVFSDPIHEIQGLPDLRKYFSRLSTSLVKCQFEYVKVIESGPSSAVFWTMSFKHKKLRSGEEIEVEGASSLEFSLGKVIRHIDYYDVGAMLYENIPILGVITRKIRQRVANDQ